jgi:hypothetical protein
MIRKEIEKKYEDIFFFQKGLDNIIQKKKERDVFFFSLSIFAHLFLIF